MVGRFSRFVGKLDCPLKIAGIAAAAATAVLRKRRRGIGRRRVTSMSG
jgi:hypothetical protein